MVEERGTAAPNYGPVLTIQGSFFEAFPAFWRPQLFNEYDLLLMVISNHIKWLKVLKFSTFHFTLI